MNEQTDFLEGGSVTSPKGFVAGAAYASIKTYAKDKWDIGILVSEKPSVTAGMYTLNKFVSPSVTLTKEHVAGGRVRSVFVSSGIAKLFDFGHSPWGISTKRKLLVTSYCGDKLIEAKKHPIVPNLLNSFACDIYFNN